MYQQICIGRREARERYSHLGILISSTQFIDSVDPCTFLLLLTFEYVTECAKPTELSNECLLITPYYCFLLLRRRKLAATSFTCR